MAGELVLIITASPTAGEQARQLLQGAGMIPVVLWAPIPLYQEATKTKIPLPASFGEALLALREAQNISQREAAARAGIHYTYLCKLERRTVSPPPRSDIIARIANALNADLLDLYIRAVADRRALGKAVHYLERKMAQVRQNQPPT